MSFGWTLFDTSVRFYACGIIMLLLVRKLGFANDRFRFVVLGYIAIAVSDILLKQLGLYPVISAFILIPETVLYAVFVFKSSLARRILWGGIISCLGQLSLNLTFLAYFLAGNQDLSSFLLPTHTRFILLVSDLLLLTFMYFIICNIGSKKAAISNPPFLLAMIGIFVFVLFAARQMAYLYINYGTVKSEAGPDTSENLVILASMLIVIYLAVLFFFEYTGYLTQKKKQTELELEQKKWETAYLEQANVTYRALSAWKHDYQNHMDVLHSFLKNKKYRDMEEYLSQMDAETGSSMQIYYTGNSVADAVLSNKLFLAQNKGIQVSAAAGISGRLTISDVQLGSILGNLLDNAIEAQDAVSQPFININIRRERGMLQIKIENSASGGYCFANDHLVSSKKGKKHGVGLESTRKIVENAGGIMDIQPEGARFTVKILLPLKTESEVS